MRVRCGTVIQIMEECDFAALVFHARLNFDEFMLKIPNPAASFQTACVWCLAVLLTGGFFWTPTTAAYPAACKPSPGGTKLCITPLVTPWVYYDTTCESMGVTSEAASFANYLPHSGYSALSHCNLKITRMGWLTTPKTIVKCGANLGVMPGAINGIEIANASQYKFEWDRCPPSSGHVTQVVETVVRQRSAPCPNGYSNEGGAYCSLNANGRDLHKNLGPQCPTCGNPISLGIGGKYQKEQDYNGSGRLPLEFTRHYNNLLTSAAWYSVTNFPGTLAQRVEMASNPEEPERQLIGMDRMGVLWRHSYQRAIVVRATTGSNGIETAAAYRDDGKVLAFNLYNGAYIPDGDVVDSLVKMGDGTWRYTTANGEQTEEYDTTGRLIKITDRTGVYQILAYDSCGLLRTVTDNFGRALTLDYTTACLGIPNTAYRVSSVTDPASGVTSFTYDSKGRLTQVTYPDGKYRVYHYDGSISTELTGISDENGVRYVNWTYDGNRRANSSTHAGGAEAVSIVYSPGSATYSGTVTSAIVTDAAGAARTYSFTAVQGVNRVTSIVQPAASGSGTVTETYGYDANGNVVNKKNFSGQRTCYAFNTTRNLETARVEGFASGVACPSNVTTYTPASGTTQRKITTQWHATYREPAQIDEPGRRTIFIYDGSGNLLTKTVLDTATSQSRTWTYTYNILGQMLTADGPRTDVSDVMTYTYYACTTGYQCGQVQTVTNALGDVTTYNTYNAHGQPTQIVDPNGLVTTLTYDTRQRLTSRTVGGETTTYTYDFTGQIHRVTLPDSSYLDYTYDAAHRLTRIDDSDGNYIAYTLDAMGNRTAEKTYDPGNFLTQQRFRVYNSLNRLWKVAGAANTTAVTTTFTYDNTGNQTGIAAPLSRNTGNAYDPLNRLTQVTDPGAGTTQFGYNALDQLVSVTDPRSKVTSYTYNALGDLVQQASPDAGTTNMTYDSGGNLATRTDARSKTGTYTYDALNRVTQLAYPDQTLQYTYDTGSGNSGRLMSLSDASGSTAWTYTAQGRVASRTQVMSGVSRTLSYGYNDAGQQTSLTTPSGQVLTFSYANNRITGITLNGSTTVLNTVSHDPFGPINGWTWGNSTLAVQTYNQDGLVTQIDSAGLRQYGYDDAFRITGITDPQNSNLSWTHQYDSLDRLAQATQTGLTQTWTYDANGNRLTQGDTTSSTFTVSITSNRLSSVTGALSRTYGYDAAGNTTSYSGLIFGYNDAGRMISVSGGAAATYAHNALGQRVKKVTGGNTTYFVYDEAGHLVGEYTGSGTLIQETVWLGDIPVATLRPNGGSVAVYYVHTDHLNTPRHISRPSDNVIVWRWDSDPFGTTAANQDPDGDSNQFVYHLRFPGQYYDAETGLNYNYFRDYDPAIGRYVESDPIGLKGGINTYAYVGANPVMRTDPEGLQSTGSLECFKYPWCIEVMYPQIPRATIDRIAKTAAAGAAMGILREMCSESAEEREQRCQERLDRDLKTCEAVGKRDGKSAYAICERQAYLKYGNCLSGRDKGINAPLPPWGTK